MGGRGEIGKVGVVVDEGALVAEVPDDPEDEAPVDHPGLNGGEERGGGHGERGNPMKSGRRMPARSASPPRKGEVRATAAMETEITRPHHRSPRPVSLPTTAIA
jgi:hypothetical protein